MLIECVLFRKMWFDLFMNFPIYNKIVRRLFCIRDFFIINQRYLLELIYEDFVCSNKLKYGWR